MLRAFGHPFSLRHVKALANEDTLLRTHCCRHKCFPVCPRPQHLLRTQILCLGHKKCFWFCSETFCVRSKCFPVCVAQETSWATMFPQQCVLVCQSLYDMLSVAYRTSAHALAQHCYANLAKQEQLHATSANFSDHFQTWAKNTQHVETHHNRVAKRWPTTLRYVALKCCHRLAWASAWQKSRAQIRVWVVQNDVHIAKTLTKGTRS